MWPAYRTLQPNSSSNLASNTVPLQQMADTKLTQTPQSSGMQLVINFVLPTVVLLGLSSESRLGPAKAMLLALAFPVAFELYSLSKRRKPSMLSIIAIVGILVTGAISLLGLSENWLAVRRSVPYIAVAIALLVSMLIKRPLLEWSLTQLLDMELIRAKAEQKKAWSELQKHIRTTGYLLVALLTAIGISAYILTLVVITAPTDTTAFNTEYVRLRLLSLPATTLPLLVGIVAILMYLLSNIEKLTGLKAEDLMKKKKQ